MKNQYRFLHWLNSYTNGNYHSMKSITFDNTNEIIRYEKNKLSFYSRLRYLFMRRKKSTRSSKTTYENLRIPPNRPSR